MKLSYSNLIDRHKGEPAIVVGSGPSLKDVIGSIPTHGELVKFFLNDWWNFFKDKNFCCPDYLVLASGEQTIPTIVDSANHHKYTVLYANSVDETPQKWVEENLKTDWLGYDQRHWEGKSCLEIISKVARWIADEYRGKTGNLPSPKARYYNRPILPLDTESQNIAQASRPDCFLDPYVEEKIKLEDFKRFGNNGIMWDYGRWAYAGLCEAARWELHGGQWRPYNVYPCNKVGDSSVKPVQEVLQRVSGLDCHYSTGDTVILHAIAFAILAGCNPIYITGMDLDYGEGYANDENTPRNDDWQQLSKNLINDLRILNESARMRGIEIINLKKDAWYGQLKHGKLK